MDKNLAHIWNTMGENSFLVLLFILVVLFLFMNKLEKEVDKLITISIEENYAGAVGAYYEYFPQVTDEEVIKLLK